MIETHLYRQNHAAHKLLHLQYTEVTPQIRRWQCRYAKHTVSPMALCRRTKVFTKFTLPAWFPLLAWNACLHKHKNSSSGIVCLTLSQHFLNSWAGTFALCRALVITYLPRFFLPQISNHFRRMRIGNLAVNSKILIDFYIHIVEQDVSMNTNACNYGHVCTRYFAINAFILCIDTSDQCQCKCGMQLHSSCSECVR